MKTVFHYRKDQEKVCDKCHLPKPVRQFNEAKKQPDGLYPSCQTCQNKKYRHKITTPIKVGNPDLDKDMRKLHYLQQLLTRSWS